MPETGHIRVHYLPQFIAEHELADHTVVVVDLLRASTTICQALAAGATDILPFVEVSRAAAASGAYNRSEIVLGGERGGERIKGFDLGNSPLEYSADVVFGKRILFTTTNGTRALEHARLAKRTVVGALVNLSAVVESISKSAHIDILCAGTGGHVTREDILAAGAMVLQLTSKSRNSWRIDEPGDRARAEWGELLRAAQAAGQSVSDRLVDELRETPGGRNLLAIGQDKDLVECARIDRLDIVPEYNSHEGRIYVA